MKRVLILLVALMLVVSAAACSADTSSSTSDGGDEAVTTSSGSGDDGGSAPKWVKVFSMKGSTAKTSPSFKLQGGEQKLKYTLKGNTMPIMAAYVEQAGWDLNEDGGFPVVSPDKAGSDSTMMSKDAGKYVVHVESANCDWTITILEKR